VKQIFILYFLLLFYADYRATVLVCYQGCKYKFEKLCLLYEKQLYSGKVFTDKVLKSLDPIIADYFSYANQEEVEAIQADMDKKYQEFEEDSDFDIW
jgi:hypothetical protein